MPLTWLMGSAQGGAARHGELLEEGEQELGCPWELRGVRNGNISALAWRRAHILSLTPSPSPKLEAKERCLPALQPKLVLSIPKLTLSIPKVPPPVRLELEAGIGPSCLRLVSQ